MIFCTPKSESQTAWHRGPLRLRGGGTIVLRTGPRATSPHVLRLGVVRATGPAGASCGGLGVSAPPTQEEGRRGEDEEEERGEEEEEEWGGLKGQA